jgi:hypothetical protein
LKNDKPREDSCPPVPTAPALHSFFFPTKTKAPTQLALRWKKKRKEAEEEERKPKTPTR